MDEINPYAPPAASVQVRDANAESPYELPIELVTPGFKVLLFFGLGTLFVSMVFAGIIAALVFFVWDVHRPPPALANLWSVRNPRSVWCVLLWSSNKHDSAT